LVITRIITAIVVLLVFLPALFFLPPSGWLALSLLLTAVATIEWSRLANLGQLSTILFTGIVVACSLGLSVWPGAEIYFFVGAGVFWIGIAPFLLYRHVDLHKPAALVPLGIVLLPAVFCALVELREISPEILLATMAVAWVSDSLAYFTGKAFGVHKLAPDISPGKTWEGVAGGLAGVTIYALICFSLGWRLIPTLALWQLIALWIALAATGIVGDLLESLMKRSAGVKDSGKILPGHGGILDRVDALLPILPLATLVHHYMTT
jgi:phosphatidate cytidylyltransferase